jgi:cellulose synthase (UDP-forming)
MSFWFFPFPRLIFMLAPLIYILLDVKIFVSNVDEAIAYTLTYMIVNVMVQNYLFGAVRWPWVSELYEYCQGVFLSKAIVSVVMNPKKPTFNVTAKGLTLDNDHLSELALPFFVIFALLLWGVVIAVLRYFLEPGISNLMAIVGLWAAFNLIMAGVALGAVAERKQLTRHPRLAIDRRGVLLINYESVPVVIVSVSAGDCVLHFDENAPAQFIESEGVKGRLFIESVGDLTDDQQSLPVVVARAPDIDSGLYDCEFETLQPEEYFALADLMYGDSDALPKFLASRRKHKSIIVGTVQFIWWGLTEPARAFAYALRRKEVEKAVAEPSETPESSIVWLRRLVVRANKQQAKRDAKKRRSPSIVKSA